MTKFLVSIVFGLFISVQTASAAQRTITLNVNNMTCEACPYLVKKSLENISGVKKVTVSFRDYTAIVVFDDAKVSVRDLTGATAKAGFPSELGR
jgi:periplasmic mercuric ion binding protein